MVSVGLAEAVEADPVGLGLREPEAEGVGLGEAGVRCPRGGSSSEMP